MCLWYKTECRLWSLTSASWGPVSRFDWTFFFQFTVEVKRLHWSRTWRVANTWSRLLWFVDSWHSVSEESNVQICMFWKFDAPSVWQTDEIANSQLWWVLFLVCLSGVCLFWTKALKERTLWSVLTTSITDQEEEYKKIFHQFEVNIHDGRHCRELIAKTGDDCTWQSTALVLDWTNVPAQNFKRWKYLWTMEWLYKKIPENSILIVTALDCKRWLKWLWCAISLLCEMNPLKLKHAISAQKSVHYYDRS